MDRVLRVWVDLANSPQVLFFRPLLRLWEQWGLRVAVTSRPFAQTTDLADRLGINHEPVGRHGGRSLAGLGAGILDRAWRLVRWARGRAFDVAVSHNSYAQLLAARLLGVSSATTMDYEFQPANHGAFRLARRVVVPEAFPEAMLRRYGAVRKAGRYPGIKEQVYLADFAPAPDFRRRHALLDEAILAVVRPAAEWALYHRGIENSLVDRLLRRLAEREDVQTVFLPRLPIQAAHARSLVRQRLMIPGEAWDGPSLVAAADLVVSGGGTMAREAAVLGTPAYSFFAGRTPAVDQYLADRGRLTFIRAPEDVATLLIERKPPGGPPLGASAGILRRISESLLGIAPPDLDPTRRA